MIRSSVIGASKLQKKRQKQNFRTYASEVLRDGAGDRDDLGPAPDPHAINFDFDREQEEEPQEGPSVEENQLLRERSPEKRRLVYSLEDHNSGN